MSILNKLTLPVTGAITVISVFLSACTAPVPTSMSPSVQPGFSIQALTPGYLERKVRHWLNQDNEPALVREIEFARVKHPDLMESMMLVDPDLYAQVAAVPAVDSQRSNADFDAFMVRLSGVLPEILSYHIDTVNTGALSQPYGVALDAAGNLYAADASRVQKITPEGVISTLASGFSNLQGMAIDTQGHLFVAEYSGHRIRKITPQGVVTTVAGTGTNSFGGDNGLAVAAQLSNPQGVAVDGAGNLYIADTGNHRIRKVDTQGVITTLAGTGTGSFSGDGNLATAATINQPVQLIVDPAGNLLFTDYGNRRLRQITPAGMISTLAGNGNATPSGNGGPALSAGLGLAYGLARDSTGHLYLSLIGNGQHWIRKITPQGVISTIAGQGTTGSGGDGGPALAANLNDPRGLFVDSLRQVYIAERAGSRIRKLIPQY